MAETGGWKPTKGVFHLYLGAPRTENHAGTMFHFANAQACAMNLAQVCKNAVWILEQVDVIDGTKQDVTIKHGWRYYVVPKEGGLPELVEKEGRPPLTLNAINGRMALIDLED